MERQSHLITNDQIGLAPSCIQRPHRNTTRFQREYLKGARPKDFKVFSTKLLFLSFYMLLCLLASVRPVYAYLDGGTASVLLQALLGSIAVGIASLSLFWQRIRNYFSSLKKTNQPDVSNNEAKDREETD